MILAVDPRDPKPNLSHAALVLTWILRFTPPFCLGKGLFNAINIELFLYLEGDDTLTAWTEPILLYEVYFLLGQSIVFPILAILLDNWSVRLVNRHGMFLFSIYLQLIFYFLTVIAIIP